MGPLQAHTDALRTHAAYCEELADQLESTAAPARSLNGHQATAAAVDAVHGAVGIAGARMAQRMRSTAAAVAATAEAFDAEERTAAAGLRSPAEGWARAATPKPAR